MQRMNEAIHFIPSKRMALRYAGREMFNVLICSLRPMPFACFCMKSNFVRLSGTR